MNKFALLATCALFLAPSLAQAQAQSPTVVPVTSAAKAQASTSDAPSSDNQTFVNDATIGGMTEIATSKIAVKKSGNADIQAFAKQMIADHGKADRRLKTIATKLNMTQPTAPDTEHQSQVSDLGALNGGDFDQRFIAIQKRDHDEAIAAFQKEVNDGTNMQLKTFAMKTLPILKNHQKMVAALSDKYPVSTTGSMDSKSGSMK